MDIKEIKEKRELLEKDILEAIKIFEKQTECHVTDIDLITVEQVGAPRKTAAVKIRILVE